jgi:formate dehydrogenase accessory protein FdhE
VLDHQQDRAADATVSAAAALAVSAADQNRASGRYPLLELHAAAEAVAAEVPRAVMAVTAAGTVPEPLAEAGRAIGSLPLETCREQVGAWLDDVSLLDPRSAFWVGVAAGPILESAAAAVTLPDRSEWTGPACPACGGWPQVSVIAEETGEFMAGSPRSLVCGRCAAWWGFARATCPHCGEEDPRKIAAHIVEGRRGVRIDVCETCNAYVKTFDLRVEGSRDVVPLVDDIASLSLDLWATTKGYRRRTVSLAGV